MAGTRGGGISETKRVVAVVAVVSLGATGSVAGAPRRAVLTDGGPAARLVQTTVAASPTVAGLADDLATNGTVIVVVELARERFEAMADLRLQAVVAGVRYLRIRIYAGLKRWEQMSMLGHELQHAREVALAPDVVDSPGLAGLMRRIGRETYRDRFETTAAIDIAGRVLHEIAFGVGGGSPPQDRQPR